ncbi:MAG: pyridoxal phosphate-dependent aminotransferase [Acidimicrobiia bacterium]
MAERIRGFGTTIFTEMSALARATGAVNLGQGFPDFDGPAEVAEAAVAAIRAGHNQYPPLGGIPELQVAIAEHQKRFWGLSVDPSSEVLVTAGATEALTATALALCDPGDEVLAFDPTYDSYGAAVTMAGGRLRTAVLRHPGLEAPIDELAALVTDRTRFVLLNSPHNPTGKVFTTAELAALAELCVSRDLLAVTDEVYEHLVYEGEHRPLASFPGMAERTLTVSSAGKTFSFTGWKVGWVCGPADLVAAVRTAKQFLTFVNGAPFQPAVAVGLGLPDGFFDGLRADFAARRDLLCAGLAGASFEVVRPQGTYFATVDVASIGEDDGLAFCRSLPERCGVVAVPSSVFYADPADGRSLVRFAFCKRTEVLQEAVERLSTLAR